MLCLVKGKVNKEWVVSTEFIECFFGVDWASKWNESIKEILPHWLFGIAINPGRSIEGCGWSNLLSGSHLPGLLKLGMLQIVSMSEKEVSAQLLSVAVC